MYTLYIKNMVCPRCLSSVDTIFKNLQIPLSSIALGEAQIFEKLSLEKRKVLEQQLLDQGFELLQDAERQLVSKIKEAVLRYSQILEPTENLSKYLSKTLGKEYNQLSKLFSQVEGRTVENYFISLRIEKAKEYISYDELNFSEIAFKLNFSSVAHLSAQFKKVTGMTPSAFKNLGSPGRKGLEKV